VSHEILVANCVRSRIRAAYSRLRPGAEESRCLSCLAEGLRWLHLEIRAALKGNDSAAVAGMTRLPFMNDGSIRDAAQFREKIYKRDFTAKNRACIQRGKSVYDRDGENNESFFIFCGQQIFVFTKTPAGFLFTDIGAND
jgi:hypothetical protein